MTALVLTFGAKALTLCVPQFAGGPLDI